MEKIRKNPVLMGILSAVGTLASLLLLELILSAINGESFQEQISTTFIIILLIVGPICSGISTYLKVKRQVEGKEKKEL